MVIIVTLTFDVAVEADDRAQALALLSAAADDLAANQDGRETDVVEDDLLAALGVAIDHERAAKGGR